MTEGYDRVKELLSKVIAGDEDAKETLSLRPIKIAPAEPRITRLNLQLAHKQHSEIAAAAKALKFSMLEECAMANMAQTRLIYKSITKEDLKLGVVEPQDYSRTILAILKEIEESIGIKKVWGSTQSTVKRADEKKSKDGVIDAGCSESGDVDVSAGGKASTAVCDISVESAEKSENAD